MPEYYCETGMKNLGFLGESKEQIFGLGGRKIRKELNKFDSFLFNMLEKMVKEGEERDEILRDIDYVNLDDVNKALSYMENKGMITKGLQ